MDLVIAVKSEPNRKARVTGKNRVTLLLSSSSEVTDTSIVHRDAVYNSKLQGTCFNCSKLNATPPTEVCDHPVGIPPPSPSCFNYDTPCVCATCPETPPTRECACANGYPAPNTPGLGSGYWAGIQANTHYSNVPNGGWVVAVACGSSEVIGAFPVTGSNFGYGRGTIMGFSAMIYPAGALYGAGYEPANETSFPILALITSDGNSLISTGTFGTIASGATTPGCPSTTPQYYCNSDTTVYSGFPKACVQKFNGDKDSACSVFANYTDWAADLPYDTSHNNQDPYLFNMAGIEIGGMTDGVIMFEDSSLNQYCGTIQDMELAPSDAASGICGGNSFPDTPISISDDCISCNQKVPCEYVVNLTNGQISTIAGGYSAAGGENGFQAIGPAFPPSFDENGALQDTEYWETFWRWTAETHEYITTEFDESGSPSILTTIIPPIGSLEDNCTCSDNESNLSSISIIEPFPCCETESNKQVRVSVPEQAIFRRIMAPGFSGCGTYCKPCIDSKCSCNSGGVDNLGPPMIYGYTPCLLCDCENAEIVFESQPSTIWWAHGIEQHTTVAFGVDGTAGTPDGGILDESCKNRCSNVLSNSSGFCDSPCGNLFDEDYSDPNTPIITLNMDRLFECSGFDNVEDLLHPDNCGRSRFLPAGLQDRSLFYNATPIGGNNPFALASYITTEEDGQGDLLLQLLCADSESPDCYLNHLSGPFGIAYDDTSKGRRCYGTDISQFIVCAVPLLKQKTFTQCDGTTCVEHDAISFVKIENNKCYEPATARILQHTQLIDADDSRIADVCSCCNRSLTADNTVVCSGGSGCPSCCSPTSGSSTGCNTGLGCGLSGVDISSKSCKPPTIDECTP